MKTLTSLSAWLDLLPLPLDQALCAPLQRTNHELFQENGVTLLKAYSRRSDSKARSKIDEEKKRERLERDKGGLSPHFPFVLPLSSPHYPNTALYYLNAWNSLCHWYHVNASHYFWTGPGKKYWGLLNLYFWWVKWQVLVIHKMNQYSGARPLGSRTSTKFRIKGPVRN